VFLFAVSVQLKRATNEPIPLVEAKKIAKKEGGAEELYDPNVDFVLDEIGKVVGQFGMARIVISGHTDSSMKGQVPASLVKELSTHRANAVREALVQKFKLDPNLDIIEKEINFKNHKVIVIAKDGWHQGVLGIVAAKIKDLFHRPSVVISMSDHLCKGSARSINNFHILEALLECKDILKGLGGHQRAAGW
jgi:single-stranded-DNA-specific exonuclease